ncbi:hypothetical protein [Nocardioides pakistanensis]
MADLDQLLDERVRSPSRRQRPAVLQLARSHVDEVVPHIVTNRHERIFAHGAAVLSRNTQVHEQWATEQRHLLAHPGVRATLPRDGDECERTD